MTDPSPVLFYLLNRLLNIDVHRGQWFTEFFDWRTLLEAEIVLEGGVVAHRLLDTLYVHPLLGGQTRVDLHFVAFPQQENSMVFLS